MMAMWLVGALVAHADAGPEDEEPTAPEESPALPVQMASLAEQGRTPPGALLPSTRGVKDLLPVCPDGRGPCRTFCTVAEPTSVLWDGMVDRDVSGPRGVWTQKRGRG
jgi:hypothetical protein